MSNKKKILIIENNKKDLQFILACLEDEDYQILIENNGADALEVIKKDKPDLILLDLLIPDVDGIQVCKELNAVCRGWKPKIIIMTHITLILDKIKKDWFKETNANNLLTKPINKNDLLEAVQRLFGQK